jgi:type IV secretory pathway TraG/TraD family ATPase VirD4
MTASERSLFVFDVKGTAAVQTAAARKCYGDVIIICPYPVHGLKSDGFNPLRWLDPKSPFFYAAAREIARAIVDLAAGTHKYWSDSAIGLLTALIMWEVIQAKRAKRPPSLYRVRLLLSEPERTGWVRDQKTGKLVRQIIGGLRYTAGLMVESGHQQIASLIGRFLREGGKDELAGIQSTALTETEFLLDPFIAADLEKGEKVDLGQLSQKATTVYVVLPPKHVEANRRWTRLLAACAINQNLRPWNVKTLFVFDEFRSTVGNLDLIREQWEVVREFGMQFMPMMQSALIARDCWGEGWETMAAQSGAVFTIGPPNDKYTAELMSGWCGRTTLVKAGLNFTDAINDGEGVNSGLGRSHTGTTQNDGDSFSLGRNLSANLTFQQTEAPVLLEQHLRMMRLGEGRIWVPGMGARSIPAFFPNYWRRNAAWVARVKANPLYHGR